LAGKRRYKVRGRRAPSERVMLPKDPALDEADSIAALKRF
jgi:hypothetical protein